MTTTLTAPDYDTCLTLLHECVAERGEDYVYSNPDRREEGPACEYMHGDQPGCIIGLMLYKYGVPIQNLQHLSGNVSDAFWKLFDVSLNDAKNKKLMRLLVDTQMAQDNQNPWGEALRKGVESAESL